MHAVRVRSLNLTERATAAPATLPSRMEGGDPAYERVAEAHDLRPLFDLDLHRRPEQQLRASPLGRPGELARRRPKSPCEARFRQQGEASALQRRGAPRRPTARLPPLHLEDGPVERREASLQGVHAAERLRRCLRALHHGARNPGGALIVQSAQGPGASGS
ncbi:MAG: hypothetical protein L3J92_03840 [Thermoplasmata archaeon]|nr:hypothetical protein [Thermoplasmata archaeon]